MKHIYLYTVLFFVVACNDAPVNSALEIEMHGETPSYVLLKTDVESDTLEVNSAAKYTYSNAGNKHYVSLNTPGIRQLLYLEDGKTLSAVMSASNLTNPLKFTGDLKVENEVLETLIDIDKAYNKTLKDVLQLNWDEYIAQHKAYINNRAEVLSNEALSEKFVKSERLRNEILLQTGAFLHYNYHPQFNPNPEPTSQECMALIEAVDLENSDALQIPEFIELAQEKIDYNLGNVPFENQTDVTKASLRLTENIKNQDIKIALQRSILSNHIEYAGIDDIADNLSVFYDNADATSVAFIKKKSAPWLAISSGNLAPDLVFNTSDGKEVKLSDYQGNAVYLDFWATWCKPCLAETPDMEALEFELRDKDIEFIAVSVDENTAAWQSFLENNNPVGVQLHQGASAQQIRDAYLVTSIPRYVLIAADGTIINANAPRPSQNALSYIQNQLFSTKEMASN